MFLIFYSHKTTENAGAQIDMVLDRKDQIVNLFEMKFYEEEFVPNKVFAANLQIKKITFKNVTKTRKQISWVLISANGVMVNQYTIGLIDNILGIDDLF